MAVTVALKNPPSGANKWQMRIVDDVGLKTMTWGGDAHGNIKDTAIFLFPANWLFPLSVDIIIYEEWQENTEWHARQLYKAQSIWPSLPNYLEVFIPDSGSYYYNVATEQFEGLASPIAITAPSSAREGERVSVSARVTNIAAESYPFRVRLYAVRDIYAVPDPDELLGIFEEVIGSGLSKTYSGTYTMPAWDTTVLVMVYRFINYWNLDNSATKVVSLEAVEYPATDIKNIAISVIGVGYPATDLRNIAIVVRGPEYPATDLRNIAISVVGVEYPTTDIKNIAISVVPVGYIPPKAEGFVKIEITKPLPSSGIFGITYKIEGSAKLFDIIGALPWLYAEVKKKEWYLPEIIEEVSYERGFPIPITGDFTIDFKPEKGGDYEVTVVATPAPLPLPVVGVFPTVGKSGMMKIKVE